MQALVLVATVGTLGDVLPAIAVGRLMAGRGHDVVVFADPDYADLVRQSDLEIDAVGQPGFLRSLVAEPDYWHSDRCFHVFAKRVVLPNIKPMMKGIERRARRGRTVVAAFSYAFGAKFAAREAGLPLARLFIQPAALDCDSPFARKMSAIQAYFGSVGRTLTAGNATDTSAVVGLFPHWFCPQKTKLRPGSITAGFPIDDGTAAQSMPRMLTDFLDAGPAPVVLLARGDPVRNRDLKEQAQAACRSLGQRLIVLGGEDAPFADENACLLAFAPFDRLLPRVAAVVHHGGIGTIAHALAAGAPQLALTSNFETPENAAAVTALGIGTAMPAGEAAPNRLQHALKSLLTSPHVSARCVEMAARMRSDNPFERVADVIEQRLTLSA